MSTDSTISDEDAPDPADRQSTIEYYVDELILRIVDSPCDPTPQLFRHITQYGPCVEPAHVLHVFGGSIIFRRTCERMNLIRDAALRDVLDAIPVDLRRWRESARPAMELPFRDYRSWRRPHIYDDDLFWYEGALSSQPGMYRNIVRYPTRADTDEYFRYREEDAYPSESEDGNWNQPLNIMETEWQYDEMMEEGMGDMDVLME